MTQWTCNKCGRTISSTGTLPPDHDCKQSLASPGADRGLIAFFAGAATGLYCWYKTQHAGLAMGAALLAAAIASTKLFGTLLFWALTVMVIYALVSG
ncbi:hypothetical protein MI467_06295 [Delftia acidovorans]|uniref:hypothetical protein n=1 Tax=Delftia acidovorans TaxID=80866 RepID=UPI001EFD4623|nr:hypothetical protein [Delftia acidovorans]MCG8986450.1 hypothetical protein [Delftia acidovorans]